MTAGLSSTVQNYWQTFGKPSPVLAAESEELEVRTVFLAHCFAGRSESLLLSRQQNAPSIHQPITPNKSGFSPLNY